MVPKKLLPRAPLASLRRGFLIDRPQLVARHPAPVAGVDRRERHACRGSDSGDAIGRNVVGHKLLPELLAGAAMAG